MKLISYTFTKEELWNTIKEVYFSAARDNLNDLFSQNGPKVIGFFEDLKGIKSKYQDHIQVWCDLFSEEFFKKNSDISDVLLLTETTNDGISIKEWMASR